MRQIITVILLSLLVCGMMLGSVSAQDNEYRCVVCGKLITKQAVVIEGELYHPACFRCPECNEQIRDEYLMGTDDKYYHRACLERISHQKCAYCDKAITEGNFITDGDKKYHDQCYHNNVAPHCDICGNPLEGSYITDYWGNRFHPRHTKDFPVCQVCGRLVWQGGVELDKGRWLCSVCDGLSVTSPERTRGLLEEVREELARMGIIVKTLRLRIEQVERDQLNSGRQVTGHSHAYAHVTWNPGSRRPGDETATINVLKGLPEDMMRGIIAHELMHVWQNENVKGNIPIEVREGSSNWASSLLYSRMQTKRAQFFLNGLEKSPDPIYGDGYRMVSKYADREGVSGVLDMLRDDGNMEVDR